MGANAKPHEVLNVNEVLARSAPVIRRFSGGGTVAVDEGITLTSVIGSTVSAFGQTAARWPGPGQAAARWPGPGQAAARWPGPGQALVASPRTGGNYCCVAFAPLTVPAAARDGRGAVPARNYAVV